MGSIGGLLAESGLKEILASTFVSVDKMLIGKKFPQNIRALRLLAEELLRPVFEKHHETLHCMNDLILLLNKLADQCKTSKLWIDNLIKPNFLIMKYCRASHEGDNLLHISAANEMLPYMFAENHHNYARYGKYYVHSMSHLPPEIHERFMKGEQTLHHKAGIWNGIWSDQFIESTYMRYGHGPSGIIGTTMKPETLKTWAYSMYACTTLINDLKEMDCSTGNNMIQMTHKEEMEARIESDASDRKSIRKTLESCMNPLEPSSLPESLVNIVSGLVAPPDVNVERAVDIGYMQMVEFEATWPEGFYSSITKRVVTFDQKKTHHGG